MWTWRTLWYDFMIQNYRLLLYDCRTINDSDDEAWKLSLICRTPCRAISRMSASLRILTLISLVAQNVAWPQDPIPRLHLKHREYLNKNKKLALTATRCAFQSVNFLQIFWHLKKLDNDYANSTLNFILWQLHNYWTNMNMERLRDNFRTLIMIYNNIIE